MTAKQVPAVATTGCFVEGRFQPSSGMAQKVTAPDRKPENEWRIRRTMHQRREDCDGYMYAWDNVFYELERHSLNTPKAQKRYKYLLEMQSRGQSMLKAMPSVVEKVEREIPDVPVIPVTLPDGRFALAIHPRFAELCRSLGGSSEIPTFAFERTPCRTDAIAEKMRSLGSSEKDVEDAMDAFWLRHRAKTDGESHEYADLYMRIAEGETAIVTHSEIQEVKVETLVEQFNQKFAFGFGFAKSDEDGDTLP